MGGLQSNVNPVFVVACCLECEFAQVVFDGVTGELLSRPFEVGVTAKGNFSGNRVVGDFVALTSYQLIVQSQLLKYYW